MNDSLESDSFAVEPQNLQTRWAVITEMGGRVVVEAETAEAAQEKVERKDILSYKSNRDASKQAVSF